MKIVGCDLHTRYQQSKLRLGGAVDLFHHKRDVRSSQTCTPIGAKIPRQCSIENCASLQRRTHFRPQTFHRYLTTYGLGQHPRKCTPNRKIKR
jgi:hypothetical protein